MIFSFFTPIFLMGIAAISFDVLAHATDDPAITSPLPAVKQLELNIERSLEYTFKQHDKAAGAGLAAATARLLRWRGDINHHIHPKDHLRIVYEHNQQFLPEILYLEYQGSQIQLIALKFIDKENGIARYFNEKGTLIEPEIIHNPVPKYTQITEIMQSGRGKRKHLGLDLKAPVGTAVILPFDGQIRRKNWSRRLNGRCLEILYNNGAIARFLHLDKIAPELRIGQKLHAGDRLGDVGSTGRSSAAHLHYEILVNGKAFEPLKFHGTRTYQLPQEDILGFQKILETYQKKVFQEKGS